MIYGNSELNDLFDTIFNNRGRSNYNYTTTLVSNDSGSELYEINHTKDGAYLFFDAPGFNKSNLKVEMEGGVIHIEGKRTYKLNNEEKNKSIIHKLFSSFVNTTYINNNTNTQEFNKIECII